MTSLEQRIRPTKTARPWLRELLGAGMLVAVTSIMLASWGVDEQRHLKDVVGEMYSFSLLLAAGFAVALRQGAVDLSIWSAAALGGAVAAGAGHAGGCPGAAFIAAGLAGAFVGAINGLVVVRFRIPSIVVTPLVGLIVAWALRCAFEGNVYSAPEGMFSGWLAMVPLGQQGTSWPWAGRPPFVLRIGLVVIIYTSVIASACVVYVAGSAAARKADRRKQSLLLAASLAASGAIASLAGAVWLAERGSTPVPSRLLGDLRPLVAAVLAGACLFAGRGRSMLVFVALGPATLATTIWRAEIAHLLAGGSRFEMLGFLGMIVCAHLAFAHIADIRRGKMSFAVAAAGMTFFGVVALSTAGMAKELGFRAICQVGGGTIWLVGAALLTTSYNLSRKSKDRQRD